MSNKNDLSIRMSSSLIVVTKNGVKHELWGLCSPVQDRRQQWKMDQDYIQKLVKQAGSTDSKKAEEAADALIYLNAFNQAEYENNFSKLEDIGVKPSAEYKKATYNQNNSSRRDFTSNNQSTQTELNDLIDVDQASTIGEMVDYMRTTKSKSKKSKGKK